MVVAVTAFVGVAVLLVVGFIQLSVCCVVTMVVVLVVVVVVVRGGGQD